MSNIHPDNLEIKIPEQHHVAFAGNSMGLPVGYMTRFGTDSVSKKRMQAIEYQVYRGKTEGIIEPKTFENKPMSGFKFGKATTRTHGWGKGTVTWTVEDPRGFQLDISSANLAQIMSCSTIENGEIIDKCVWGNLRNENVLIPVSSDVYKSAQENTARVNQRVSLRDAKPGNTVLTHEALKGIYLGSMYPVQKNYSHDNTRAHLENKRYIIAETDDAGKWLKLHILTTLKLSEITDYSVISQDEAEQKANEYLTNRGSTNKYSNIIGMLVKKPESFDTIIEESPISNVDAQKLALDHSNYSKLMVVEFADRKGIVSCGSLTPRHTKTTVSVSRIDADSWDNQRQVRYIKVRDSRGTSYYSSYERTEVFEIDPMDPTVKFYEVALKHTSELGNEYTFKI